MKLLTILSSLFVAASSFAIEIRIDYTYDTGNFFDTQEKRDVIEAVANFYGDMIQDQLLAIDPAEFDQASWNARFTHPTTGAVESISNPVIPENVIIVYVGARELGGSVTGRGGPGGFNASGFSDWFARIRGRGNDDADSSVDSENTDFALWGGSIAFDTPRTWNFSTEMNTTGTEFVRTAMHEMAHVLGIGTADSWDNLVDAINAKFLGPNAIRSNGGVQPDTQQAFFPPETEGGDPIPAPGSHFSDENSTSFGIFAAVHGTSRPALMNPSSTDTGTNFDVTSDLDLAALVDIGWELNPPSRFEIADVTASTVTVSWNSVSFKNYTLERATELASFSVVGSVGGDGDGTTQSLNESLDPAGKAFYRLDVADIPEAAPQALNSAFAFSFSEPIEETPTTDSEAPREIECSTCSNHY